MQSLGALMPRLAHILQQRQQSKLMDLAWCARIYAGWPGRSSWPSPEAKAGELRALQQMMVYLQVCQEPSASTPAAAPADGKVRPA